MVRVPSLLVVVTGGACALVAMAGCKNGGDEDPNVEGKYDGVGFSPSNLKGALTAEGLHKDFSCRRVDSELSATDFSACSGDAKVVPFTQADGTGIDVIFVKNLRIDDPADMIIRGERPIAFVSFGDVSITGTIRVLAGGFDSGTVGQRDGSGPGAGKFGASTGSGAGYCGKGGGTADGASPGPAYGGASLTPLAPGSSGGGGNGSNATGGTGGGAIQIVAAHAIAVDGSINVGGVAGKATAGGGSGGAILLEAPEIDIGGTLLANGGAGGGDTVAGESSTTTPDPAKGGGAVGGDGSGGGNIDGAPAKGANGGGGGGAGRIRINTEGGHASLNGSLSPQAKTCTSEGKISK